MKSTLKTYICFTFRSPHHSSHSNSNFDENLFCDKNGITVSEEADFQVLKIGREKSVTLWIRNCGVTPQKYIDCFIENENSQFLVENVKYLKEYSAMIRSGENQTVTGPVMLYPAKSMYVNVVCQARYVVFRDEVAIFIT